MSYNVLLSHSILGASSNVEGIGSGFRQAAIVAVKEDCNPYGMRVFLGCSGEPDERSVYQDVAGLGDEIKFDFIEQLYLAMLENKKAKELK